MPKSKRVIPLHTSQNCGGGLEFYLRRDNRFPFPVKLPLVSDVRQKMKEDIDGLKKKLQSGFGPHCEKCLIVWNMVQNITYRPETLDVDLAYEKEAEEKRKAEEEQKAEQERFSKGTQVPTKATPKVPDFMVLECIADLKTDEGIHHSIQCLHPEWNVSVETVRTLMRR